MGLGSCIYYVCGGFNVFSRSLTVPFANGVARVTALGEVVGERLELQGEAGARAGEEIGVLEARVGRVAAGEDGGARGGADGVAVVVREVGSLANEGVEEGRLGVGAVEGDVIVTQIVRDDQEDIWGGG